jgi:hypothetical protein
MLHHGPNGLLWLVAELPSHHDLDTLLVEFKSCETKKTLSVGDTKPFSVSR